MSQTFKTKEIEYYGKRNILTQNVNGACSILAIINSLILTVQPTSPPEIHDLVALVNSQDEIPLANLQQQLAQVAIANQKIYGISPEEIQTTLSLLPSLHSGLNINPTFDGGFSQSHELSIFRVFQLPIVHGWLVDPEDAEYSAVSKYNSYEAGQNVLVEAYELQNKVERDQVDDEIIKDSKQISHFFARTATQLTDYGLSYLKNNLQENSVAIFFRNDHFGTIIKKGNDIYELVTDVGFVNKPRYVWESLLSINGSINSFFTGDFSPLVDNSSNPFDDHAGNYEELTPQEQDDRDYALALQQEEDQRAADALQRKYNKTTPNANSSKSDKVKKSKKEKKEKKEKKDKKCIIM